MTTQDTINMVRDNLQKPRGRRDVLKVLGIGLTLPAAATVLAYNGKAFASVPA